MKIHHLPDLDLARIAPMGRDQKRAELQRMKLNRPPYSYRPMRLSILDILNVQPGPLVDVARTPWRAIEREIIQRCKSTDEIEANLIAANSLYRFAEQLNINGRRQEFMPMTIAVSASVTYWSSAVLAVENRPTVPFIDPRKAKRLTAEARQFVFSMMHEHIRAAEPDFANVQLAILQFSHVVDGARSAQIYLDRSVHLLDFESMENMVRETYEIWREILEEREFEAHRRAGGERGSLI